MFSKGPELGGAESEHFVSSHPRVGCMYSVKGLSERGQRVNKVYPLMPEWEPYKVKEEGCWLSEANTDKRSWLLQGPGWPLVPMG